MGGDSQPSRVQLWLCRWGWPRETQAVPLVLVLASNQQFAQFAKEGRTRFICSLSVGAASIRACLSQYRLGSSASPTACDDLHAQGTVLRGFARVVRVEVVEQVTPLCFTSSECLLGLCSPSQLLVLLCSPSQLLVLVRLTMYRDIPLLVASLVCRSSADFSVSQIVERNSSLSARSKTWWRVKSKLESEMRETKRTLRSTTRTRSSNGRKKHCSWKS